MDQAERAAGEEVGGRVNVSNLFGSKGEGGVCEAVGGDMLDRCREDGFFDRVEGSGSLRVVV